MIENNNLQENELVNEGEMIDDTAMKADLDADFEALDRKKNSLDSKKIISKNKDKDESMEVMRKVFETMKSQGVDLSDQDSIREFLIKLEEQDPDLVILFEQAINSLAPEDPMSFGPMEGAGLQPNELSGARLPGASTLGMEQGEAEGQVMGDGAGMFPLSEETPVPASPNIDTTGNQGVNKFDGIRNQILRR